MAINPNISLAVRGIELQDPLAQYGKVVAIQNAQQQNQLAQLQMREAQATAEERNALRQLDPTSADYENQLFKLNPDLGIKFRKEAATTAAQKSAQAKSDFEVQKLKRDFVAQARRDTSRNPSDANITAYKEDLIANPMFTAEEKQQMAAGADRILAMPIAERGAFMASQGASASELKPVVSVGPTGIVQTPAFGGAATIVPGTAAAFQMTPAQIEANKIAQGQLGVSQNQLGIAQQRLGLEEQRVGLEGQRVSIAEREAEQKAKGLEALPPKEIQKREAALPQATAAVKGFESKSESFIRDLVALRNHPGLSQITGIAAGRLPGITSEGRAAQALYDKVVAKGGFQALQDMRDASKTGGALGNVSNQEGKQLTASFAAIDRKQDAPDVRAAIDQAIGDIEVAKVRMREAYDNTYAYKDGAAAAPEKPTMSPVDKQALDWANSNPNDPRAAAIKQRLGM